MPINRLQHQHNRERSQWAANDRQRAAEYRRLAANALDMAVQYERHDENEAGQLLDLAACYERWAADCARQSQNH